MNSPLRNACIVTFWKGTELNKWSQFFRIEGSMMPIDQIGLGRSATWICVAKAGEKKMTRSMQYHTIQGDLMKRTEVLRWLFFVFVVHSLSGEYSWILMARPGSRSRTVGARFSHNLDGFSILKSVPACFWWSCGRSKASPCWPSHRPPPCRGWAGQGEIPHFLVDKEKVFPSIFLHFQCSPFVRIGY